MSAVSSDTMQTRASQHLLEKVKVRDFILEHYAKLKIKSQDFQNMHYRAKLGGGCYIEFEPFPFDVGSFQYAFRGELLKSSHTDNQLHRTGSIFVVKIPQMTPGFRHASQNDRYHWLRTTAQMAVERQNKAIQFARDWMKLNVTKKIEIAKCWIALIDKMPKTRNDDIGNALKNAADHLHISELLFEGSHATIETFIEGNFVKYLNNDGKHSALKPNLPSAFAHWTWQASGGKYMVCDIQGVRKATKYMLTDPSIHSSNGPLGRQFGVSDLGEVGMFYFFRNHDCNDLCRDLRLESMQHVRKLEYNSIDLDTREKEPSYILNMKHDLSNWLRMQRVEKKSLRGKNDPIPASITATDSSDGIVAVSPTGIVDQLYHPALADSENSQFKPSSLATCTLQAALHDVPTHGKFKRPSDLPALPLPDDSGSSLQGEEIGVGADNNLGETSKISSSTSISKSSVVSMNAQSTPEAQHDESESGDKQVQKDDEISINDEKEPTNELESEGQTTAVEETANEEEEPRVTYEIDLDDAQEIVDESSENDEDNAIKEDSDAHENGVAAATEDASENEQIDVTEEDKTELIELENSPSENYNDEIDKEEDENKEESKDEKKEKLSEVSVSAGSAAGSVETDSAIVKEENNSKENDSGEQFKTSTQTNDEAQQAGESSEEVIVDNNGDSGITLDEEADSESESAQQTSSSSDTGDEATSVTDESSTVKDEPANTDEENNVIAVEEEIVGKKDQDQENDGKDHSEDQSATSPSIESSSGSSMELEDQEIYESSVKITIEESDKNSEKEQDEEPCSSETVDNIIEAESTHQEVISEEATFVKEAHEGSEEEETSVGADSIQTQNAHLEEQNAHLEENEAESSQENSSDSNEENLKPNEFQDDDSVQAIVKEHLNEFLGIESPESSSNSMGDGTITRAGSMENIQEIAAGDSASRKSEENEEAAEPAHTSPTAHIKVFFSDAKEDYSEKSSENLNDFIENDESEEKSSNTDGESDRLQKIERTPTIETDTSSNSENVRADSDAQQTRTEESTQSMFGDKNSEGADADKGCCSNSESPVIVDQEGIQHEGSIEWVSQDLAASNEDITIILTSTDNAGNDSVSEKVSFDNSPITHVFGTSAESSDSNDCSIQSEGEVTQVEYVIGDDRKPHLISTGNFLDSKQKKVRFNDEHSKTQNEYFIYGNFDRPSCCSQRQRSKNDVPEKDAGAMVADASKVQDVPEIGLDKESADEQAGDGHDQEAVVNDTQVVAENELPKSVVIPNIGIIDFAVEADESRSCLGAIMIALSHAKRCESFEASTIITRIGETILKSRFFIIVPSEGSQETTQEAKKRAANIVFESEKIGCFLIDVELLAFAEAFAQPVVFHKAKLSGDDLIIDQNSSERISPTTKESERRPIHIAMYKEDGSEKFVALCR